MAHPVVSFHPSGTTFFCSTFGVYNPCQASMDCMKVLRNNPELKCIRSSTTTSRHRVSFSSNCPREVLALRAHCVHTAHAEARILTQVIRLVMTVLFPRNPFQKNEPSKNILLFMEALFLYTKPRAQDQCFTTTR